MQHLTKIGFEAMDQTLGDAGQDERAEITALLVALPEDVREKIDYAVGGYGLAVSEAAFVAGLTVGRDPLAWLVSAG